jgi:hypothetical protein
MAPLIRLTRKDQPFSWGVEAENAFQSLKASFTIVPFLIHAKPSNFLVLEMDASNFAVGAVFSQIGEDNLFLPVSFHSRKFSPTKINYKIHDKELLAIVDAFEEWCHFFEGVQHEIVVYLDHKNLQYFMTIHVLK